MTLRIGTESFLCPSGPLSVPPTDSKIHIDFLYLRLSTATQGPMFFNKDKFWKRFNSRLYKYRNSDKIGLNLLRINFEEQKELKFKNCSKTIIFFIISLNLLIKYISELKL